MQNDQGPPAPTPNGTSLNIQPPEFGPDYSNNLQGYKVYKRSDGNKKLILILTIILSAMLVISAGLYFWIHASAKPPAKSPDNGSVTTPPATGTDNASLQQNLDDLAKSISQGDKDQTGIDVGVNDKKSQVEVPTN